MGVLFLVSKKLDCAAKTLAYFFARKPPLLTSTQAFCVRGSITFADVSPASSMAWSSVSLILMIPAG
jgi:hypothetical protein